MLLPATDAGLSIPATAAVCCCAAAAAAKVALLLQRLADALPRLPFPPVA